MKKEKFRILIIQFLIYCIISIIITINSIITVYFMYYMLVLNNILLTIIYYISLNLCYLISGILFYNFILLEKRYQRL